MRNVISKSTKQWVHVSLLCMLLVPAGLGKTWANGIDVSIATARIKVNPDETWNWTSGGSLTGAELGKLIESQIGAENYQLVTAMVNTCYSGAGLDSISGQLLGTSNIISSSAANQTSHTSGQSGDFFWSFWNDVVSNPNATVDSHRNVAIGTMTITSTDANVKRIDSTYPMYVEYINKLNKMRIAKGQPALPIKSKEEYKNSMLQDPMNKQNNGNPGSQKLASGTASNHAIIYRTVSDPVRDKVTDKAKEGLSAAGFTVKEFTPMTTADTQELAKAKVEKRLPNVRDDLATPENLAKFLKELKPQMNNKEHLLVYVTSHGRAITLSNSTQASTGVGRGTVFNSFNNTDTIDMATTILDLGEEVQYDDGTYVVDDKMLTRWGTSRLVLQTAETTNGSGQPVGVYLNNLLLGSMDLGDDDGYYEYELSPELIREVIDTTDAQAGFQVRFDFADIGDAFRLSTHEDLAATNWDFGFHGINLVSDIEPVTVPEPSALLLYGIGVLGVLRYIRRQSRTSRETYGGRS